MPFWPVIDSTFAVVRHDRASPTHGQDLARTGRATLWPNVIRDYDEAQQLARPLAVARSEGLWGSGCRTRKVWPVRQSLSRHRRRVGKLAYVCTAAQGGNVRFCRRSHAWATYPDVRKANRGLDRGISARTLMPPMGIRPCRADCLQRRSEMSWPIGEFGMAIQPSVLAAARSSSPGGQDWPCLAARAVSAAMTASKASCERLIVSS